MCVCVCVYVCARARAHALFPGCFKEHLPVPVYTCKDNHNPQSPYTCRLQSMCPGHAMGYEFLRGALGEKEARPRFLLARLLSTQRAEPSERVEAHSAICRAPKGPPGYPWSKLSLCC